MHQPFMTFAKSLRYTAAVLAANAALALIGPAQAKAGVISVTSTVTPLGNSEYQYTYLLSGSVSAGDTLAIYFPAATASDITDMSVTATPFTTGVLQPDAALPADGEYDVTTTADTSAFDGYFAAGYVYSGTAAPGVQDYTLYDASFAPIETGTTTVLPEPAGAALLCLAVTPLLMRRRRGRA